MDASVWRGVLVAFVFASRLHHVFMSRRQCAPTPLPSPPVPHNVSRPRLDIVFPHRTINAGASRAPSFDDHRRTRGMRSALQRTTRHASLRTLGMRSMSSATPLAALDRFEPRHLGPRVSDHPEMLATIGVDSVSDLVTKTVPSQILLGRALDLGKVRRGSHARAARDEQHHTEWPGKRRVSDLRTQP